MRTNKVFDEGFLTLATLAAATLLLLGAFVGPMSVSPAAHAHAATEVVTAATIVTHAG